MERAEVAGVRYVYYDFDASRSGARGARDGIVLPDEVADYVAVLRHECMKRGIEVEILTQRSLHSRRQHRVAEPGPPLIERRRRSPLSGRCAGIPSSWVGAWADWWR